MLGFVLVYVRKNGVFNVVCHRQLLRMGQMPILLYGGPDSTKKPRKIVGAEGILGYWETQAAALSNVTSGFSSSPTA